MKHDEDLAEYQADQSHAMSLLIAAIAVIIALISVYFTTSGYISENSVALLIVVLIFIVIFSFSRAKEANSEHYRSALTIRKTLLRLRKNGNLEQLSNEKAKKLLRLLEDNKSSIEKQEESKANKYIEELFSNDHKEES